jgi:flagellin-like protein
VDSRGASTHNKCNYGKLTGEQKVSKVPFRIIKSRKGISPILAALILIVIAVAATVITFDWIVTRTGIAAAEVGKQIHTAMLTF